MKRTLLAAFLFLSFLQHSFHASAQTGVLTLYGLGPLQTDDAFVGYYMLVQTDKPEKDKVKYSLSILDPSLNRVAEKTLIEDEAFKFASSAFDGTHIILKYLGPPSDDKEARDAGERQLVRIYDTKLNQVKTRTNAIGKTYGSVNYTADQASPFGLHPAPGGGFVNFNTIDTEPQGKMRAGSVEREGFYVEYIPTAPTATGWRYKSPEKRFEIHHFLGQTPKHVYVSTMEKEKIFDWNLDYKIMGYDRAANGRKTRFADTFASAYSLVPARVSYIPETRQALFSGVYFEKSKSEAFSKSLGIFAFTADSLGKTASSTFLSWTELAKQASGQGGEDFGKLYIQHVVRVADGRVFLIGERFSTGASASVGNILSRATTMGTTGTKRVKVGDLTILEMTPDLKLQKVHNFSKPGRDVELLSAIGAPSTEFQLYSTSSTLDYRFAQQSADKASFVIYYSLPKGKSNSDIGAVVYSNGKFSQDKMPISVDDDQLTLLPNAFGSVGIFEYYKKDKRLDSRVVKVNY